MALHQKREQSLEGDSKTLNENKPCHCHSFLWKNWGQLWGVGVGWAGQPSVVCEDEFNKMGSLFSSLSGCFLQGCYRK